MYLFIMQIFLLKKMFFNLVLMREPCHYGKPEIANRLWLALYHLLWKEHSPVNHLAEPASHLFAMRVELPTEGRPLGVGLR
jgi:hypothetical protein